MLGMNQPGYITTQGFSTSMPTQGLKPSFTTIYILIPNDGDDPTWFISTQGSSALMPTQGHKPSYTTSYILIPNDISIQGFSASMSHKGTSLAIQQIQ